MSTSRFNKVRVGTAFQFEQGGAVFIKCRGGFRPGCGGQLYSCEPTQIIIVYK